jgi:sugar phosphate isomerase/epimerase
LERIAAAGFTHIHWCHHWNTDFFYSEPEITQISHWLDGYNLRLLNLHASQGVEKYWCSFLEYQRQAGVELLQNLIGMAAQLGADVVIIHVPSNDDAKTREVKLGPVRRSLDELVPFAKIQAIANGEYREKSAQQIRGNGYVVDTLEAALWCFWTNDTFSEAVLMAANLGDDADTTAAICGQIAGAYYGQAGIPVPWLDKLSMRDEIISLTVKLAG